MSLGCAIGWWVSHGGVAAESSQAPASSASPPASPQKRDPFIPLVRDGRLLSLVSKAPRVSDVPLNLAGILWDPGGHSLALINETELRVGDTIHEYRVTDIRPDAVMLVRGDQTITLQIAFDEPVKPKAAATSHPSGRR